MGDRNTQSGIYFYGDWHESVKDYASGIWIASPASNSEKGYETSCIYAAYGNGHIVYNGISSNNGMGIRPIIALNSNVQFTANGDGTYTIKP